MEDKRKLLNDFLTAFPFGNFVGNAVGQIYEPKQIGLFLLLG